MQRANYHTFLKHELRLHMESNQLSPPDPLQIDNQRHDYSTNKGIAFYIAFEESAIGGDKQSLASEYGLIDEGRPVRFWLSSKEVLNR